MTQDGYGVVVTPAQLRHLESQKDGVHVLDLRTNATAFLELSALVAAAELEERPRAVAGGDARKGAECHRHVFHVKWNAKGTRLLVVVRARGHGCPRGDANHALTVDPDGADVRVVATERGRGMETEVFGGNEGLTHRGRLLKLRVRVARVLRGDAAGGGRRRGRHRAGSAAAPRLRPRVPGHELDPGTHRRARGGC